MSKPSEFAALAEFTPEMQAAATKEGWGLFWVSSRRIEIEMIDFPEDDSAPVFKSDLDAVAHVRQRAAEGSEMHALALAYEEQTLALAAN